MPSPTQQPLLLLTLASWNVPDGAPFPLLNKEEKPITLVQAADRDCWSYLRSPLFYQNVNAAKRDGALLEGLAISGGVSLASFADGLEGSTVPRFLARLVLVLCKLGSIAPSDFDTTDAFAAKIERATPPSFATAKIPILAPANSGAFPDLLGKIGVCHGVTDRPADGERRDGTIFRTLETPDYGDELQDDDGNDSAEEGCVGDDEAEGNDEADLGDGNDKESNMKIVATLESKNLPKLTAGVMSQILARIPDDVDMHIIVTTEVAPRGFHQKASKWREECRKCSHKALESGQRKDVLVVAARWGKDEEPQLDWVNCGGKPLKSRKAKLVIFILCVPLSTNEPPTKKLKGS
jgi:hypothetical protein